jgi:ubiquinone/menaquinone biosynthesis C-methylase UbiE
MDCVRSIPLVSQQKARSIEELRLSEGDSALDVGCGTGEEVVTMARIVGPTGRAVGIDISEAMLVEARKRVAGLSLPIEIQKGDIYALPFEPGAFAGTRAERVFEHLERPEAALAELLRVTRPGGRIVAISPDVDCQAYEVIDRSLTRKLIHSNCDARTNGWAGRQLYRLFAQAGMTDISCTVFSHVVTNLTNPPAISSFKTNIARALRRGDISEAESEAALDYLGKQDSVFLVTPWFLVSGTKQ